MTLTLELTPEQEVALVAQAKAAGLSEAGYLKGLLEHLEHLGEIRLPVEQEHPIIEAQKPMTGREALAFWESEGVLGIFSDRPEDSPELARTLRQQAQTRNIGAAGM